ncbi:MAG TPA: hypothetical protein VNU71_13555 [Burkholderiaceae bacterium]|nr:hypothetical protein [Burkholderiaceae bacterium]
MDKPAFTEVDAMRAVAGGACRTLGLGTGFVNGRGWLHQPIPGPVLLRLSGSGTIAQIGRPAQATLTLDMRAGKPYYVIVDAPPSSRLEWKVPGYDWGPVPIGFQLPPMK